MQERVAERTNIPRLLGLGLLLVLALIFAWSRAGASWAVLLRPEDPAGWDRLGAIQASQGRYSDAVDAYQRAQRLLPTAARAEVLGNCCLTQGRAAEAEASYRQQLSLDPGSPRAHANLGYALFNLQRVPEALAELKAALALDPANADAARLADRIRQGPPLPLAAEEARQRALLKAEPWDPDHGDRLGRILADQGRFKEALPYFQHAQQVKPCWRYAGNLGSCQLALGHFVEAEAVYRQTVALEPKNSEAHAFLGRALAALKRWPEALAQEDAALALDPENFSAQRLEEQLLQQGGGPAGSPIH